MKRFLIPLALVLLLAMAGCGNTQQEPQPQESMTSPMTADHSLWQQEPYYVLQFNTDSVISNAPAAAAAASSSRIVLSQAGTYLISGTLEDAQLVLDVPAGETVRLVLRGVDMRSERGPALLSRDGCTVVLLAEKGTYNTISDGAAYPYTSGLLQEATVSTAGDLLITGEGSLTIDATHYDGIYSGGRLAAAGGELSITAWRDGLVGAKGVEIGGGTLLITCGSTAISAPSAKNGEGSITLSGGTVAVVSGGSGAVAADTLSVTGGEYHITTGGGSGNRSYGEGSEKWGLWGGLPQQSAQQEPAFSEREAPISESAHGLAAGGTLSLSGGVITLDCSDEALYSDSALLLSGSTVTVSGGDTALASEGQVTLSAGTVTVLTARRGVTAQDMTVTGGSLSAVTAEEGLLLAGGCGEEETEVSDFRRMTVTGGTLLLCSGTDTVDICGSLFQSGGTLLLASGREQSPLRCAAARVSGGTLLAAGYLPEKLKISTGLPRIGVELWLTGGRPLTVTAAGERTPLLSFTPQASVGYVTVVSDELEPNTTYYLVSGSARIGADPE